MKLTKREKNLISFMVLVLTVVLTYVFIILPLQESISLQKAMNVSLTEQKNLIDAQLANNQGLDQKLTDALNAVNAEFAKIEAPISSEEFELRLQPILVVNDIKIVSWIVNDPVVTAPKLPTYQDAGYIYKLKELVESYRGTPSNTNTIPVSTVELVMTNVVFTFTSSYNDYVEVLDAIRGWGSTVYVSSTSRDNSSGDAVISIDFYSIEKP